MNAHEDFLSGIVRNSGADSWGYSPQFDIDLPGFYKRRASILQEAVTGQRQGPGTVYLTTGRRNPDRRENFQINAAIHCDFPPKLEILIKNLLNKKNLAGRYCVSTRTIDNWMQTFLPFYKPSYGVVRFDPEECDRALEKFKVNSNSDN